MINTFKRFNYYQTSNFVADDGDDDVTLETTDDLTAEEQSFLEHENDPVLIARFWEERNKDESSAQPHDVDPVDKPEPEEADDIVRKLLDAYNSENEIDFEATDIYKKFFNIIDDIVQDLAKEGMTRADYIEGLDLSDYGIDTNVLTEDILKTLLSAMTDTALKEALPDDMKNVLNVMLLAEKADELRRIANQYYQPGDTVGNVLFNYLSDYTDNIMADYRAHVSDINSEISNDLLAMVDELFKEKFDHVHNINASLMFQMLLREMDNMVDEKLPLADYEYWYQFGVVGLMKALLPYVESIDIGWEDFGVMLMNNISELPNSDDSMIASMLFTIGSLIPKGKLSSILSKDSAFGVFQVAVSKMAGAYSYQRDDWVRMYIPAYLILGVTTNYLGGKNGDLAGLTETMNELGMEQLAIPLGASGRVLLYTPDRVGPDFIIVDKSSITNFSKVFKLASKISPKIKKLGLAVKLFMTGTAIMTYDLQDADYTAVLNDALRPVVHGLVSPKLLGELTTPDIPDQVFRKEGIDAQQFIDQLTKTKGVDDSGNFTLNAADIKETFDAINDIKDMSEVVYGTVPGVHEIVDDVVDIVEEVVPRRSDDVDPPLAEGIAGATRNTPFVSEELLDDNDDKVVGSEGLTKKSYKEEDLL